MRTKQVPIADLKLAKYNPRQITDHDMASLVNSIREFGFVEPVVVNRDNTVIGGHQRIIACKQLSYEKVPVVYVDLTKKKEKILNLALNRIHGDWDMQKLSVVLEELKMNDGDELYLTGFELGEIDEIIDSQQEVDDTEDNFDAQSAAAAIKKPKSKRGEVYQLGRHRLMCGDATCRQDVEKLMGGKKADMVFTDPPYGINLNTDWTKLKGSNRLKQRIGHGVRGHRYRKVVGDNCSFDFKNFANLNVQEQFWWGADYYAEQLPKGGSWIIWDKRLNETMDRVMGSPFEVLWSKKPHRKEIIRAAWAGAYGFHEDTPTRIHPTQKPVRVTLFVVEKYSEVGWLIVDFFGGSGTTLIACERTGRICYMMEIDPIYCDVIRKRYEEYVGENKRKTA